jgi:hypothetical protein
MNRLKRLSFVGLEVLGSGIMAYASVVAVTYFFDPDPLRGLLWIASLVGAVGWWLLQLGIRLNHGYASDGLDQADAGPWVLWFRAFVGDRGFAFLPFAKALAQPWARTHEQLVLSMLRHLGTPVAVAQPGRSVAPLGAHRIRLDEEDWQAQVSLLLEDTELACFVASGSRHLAWELREAFSRLPAHRVLISIPGRWSFQRRLAYTSFRNSVVDVVADLPRDLPKESRFIAFSEQREAAFVAPEDLPPSGGGRPSGLAGPVERSLAAALGRAYGFVPPEVYSLDRFQAHLPRRVWLMLGLWSGAGLLAIVLFLLGEI